MKCAIWKVPPSPVRFRRRVSRAGGSQGTRERPPSRVALRSRISVPSPVASRNVTPSRSSHSSGQPSDFSAGRQVATHWPALAKSGSPLTRNTTASLSKTRGETRTVSGGSSRLVRRCASSGVPSWDRAGLPCGRHTLASRQLRRRVRARKVQTRVSTAADGAPAPGRLVSPARPCDAARTGSNAARRPASAQWMCRPDASLPPGVPGRPHGP